MPLATIRSHNFTHHWIQRQFHMAATIRGLAGGTPSQRMVFVRFEIQDSSSSESSLTILVLQMVATLLRNTRRLCLGHSWQEPTAEISPLGTPDYAPTICTSSVVLRASCCL